MTKSKYEQLNGRTYEQMGMRAFKPKDLTPEQKAAKIRYYQDCSALEGWAARGFRAS